jgi:hypothetical protein
MFCGPQNAPDRPDLFPIVLQLDGNYDVGLSLPVALAGVVSPEVGQPLGLPCCRNMLCGIASTAGR